MDDIFSIDACEPNSYCKIRDHLFKKLSPILKSNRQLIFLCIGTDRATGDSLGPLIGYKLKSIRRENIYIYGTLENPIHSKNLSAICDRIKESFNNPFIIGIDASLGPINNVGKIYIEDKPLYPGTALNKDLPPIGEMSITGIVNFTSKFEFVVLQNTRLYNVMELADSISKGIYHFIIKSVGGPHNCTFKDNNIDFDLILNK